MSVNRSSVNRSSRRRFLQSAAVTVGLPFLPSVMRVGSRARAATCGAPQRFLSWFLPCGVVMPDWTPTTTGTGWTMPYILEPLAPVRSKIVVLTGHDHMVSTTSNPGGHSAGTAGFLTMRKIANDYTDANRTSLDQVIAKQTAACMRPLGSLQLSVSVPVVGPQGGPHTEHTFVSILNAFGIPATTFGDATVSGPNTDILP